MTGEVDLVEEADLDRYLGRRLLDLAAARGLRLGCAPDTLLGAGMQTALRTVRSGDIGTARSGFANFQYGGPNWIPVTGDWDDRGTDTPGAVDAFGNWFLPNG